MFGFIIALRNSDNLLLVENLAKTAKTDIKKITKPIEEFLIYPALRGKDVKRWYFKPCLHIIVPHVPEIATVIKETDLKINYPKTCEFLRSFEQILKERTIKPFLGAKKKTLPFYILDNIGVRTFSKYKTAWKHISGKISGKAVLDAFVISPLENVKVIIPTHGLLFIPSHDKNEAHYLCGILNSSIAYLIVMTYALEVHITTDVPKYVFLPKFDRTNNVHKEISELSRKAHALAQKYYEQNDKVAQEELREIEDKIDKTVAILYGITENELEELNRALRILKEGRF